MSSIITHEKSPDKPAVLQGFSGISVGVFARKGGDVAKSGCLTSHYFAAFQGFTQRISCRNRAVEGTAFGGGLGANFWAGRGAFEKPISIVGEWGAYRTEIYFV
jgi:hypothetical protein